ncbi:hypothetical protein JCM17823_24320 [Halorubrum gandharaense]
MSTPAPLNRAVSELPFAGRMSETVRAAAFWSAVAIPMSYPPLLYAGLDGLTGYLFVSLLFCNALALAVGHEYNNG